MLKEILEEIEKSPGPTTVRELSRRLGIDEEALKGMLDFLSRKGRISWGDPTRQFVCWERVCKSCIYISSCKISGKED